LRAIKNENDQYLFILLFLNIYCHKLYLIDFFAYSLKTNYINSYFLEKYHWKILENTIKKFGFTKTYFRDIEFGRNVRFAKFNYCKILFHYERFIYNKTK